MRILSLLPAATEIVYLLELGDDLVGVTHECDWPIDARSKRRVSHSNIPVDALPAEIDRLVSESMKGGPPTHGLDLDAIRDIKPDIVLTQDLCAVCAVPAGHLQAALDLLDIDAEVISLDPASISDVLSDISRVGATLGVKSRANGIVETLQRRLDRVREAVEGCKRPRVFALEWGDPPYNAGHWVPEMIELAGGESLLSSKGVPSVRLNWSTIASENPEVIVFMPCGYGLDEAMTEAVDLIDRPEFANARSFFATAANSFFSRPGPRLVDGVEALAAVLHEDRGLELRSDAIARLR
ncbi:MAG TPA: ABC transporter substrate-binding protein [Acidimicrobiales bacterium]|nr:ABC transporter substrate-binding protein [Acidimicrobiales bacterium]